MMGTWISKMAKKAAESLTEGRTMSSVAKWYIALVVALGTGLLLLAARWWSSASLTQFAALLCFTLFASTLKVRIPGMTSTISPNFAFLLMGMAFFCFSQVIVAALGAALVQSFWRPKSRPRMIQVLFSAAALGVLAGTLYFFMNPVLVSIVVALTEQRPLKQVCQHCYEWVFPYFALGIVVMGLMSGSFSTTTAWRSSLQVAPAMVLAYLYFLGRSTKQVEARTASEEAEELLTSSPRR